MFVRHSVSSYRRSPLQGVSRSPSSLTNRGNLSSSSSSFRHPLPSTPEIDVLSLSLPPSIHGQREMSPRLYRKQKIQYISYKYCYATYHPQNEKLHLAVWDSKVSLSLCEKVVGQCVLPPLLLLLRFGTGLAPASSPSLQSVVYVLVRSPPPPHFPYRLDEKNRVNK